MISDELDQPKNNCEHFMLKAGVAGELLPIEEFNDRCRKKEFVEGPFKESFGDGMGEPYNPKRQVFGKLNDGRYVWAKLY